MQSPTIALAPADLTPGETYFLLRDSIIPRPIAWVSTISAAGITNLAPFSWFNVCCPVPPVLGFSCGPRGDDHAADRVLKDTYTNVVETNEFVVNLVPETLVDAMMETSADHPPGASEFAAAGLEEVASTHVKPPRVGGVPVAFECRVRQIVDLGKNHWIMGDVVQIHVAESVYVGPRGNMKHRVDLLAQDDTRPIGRLGRALYARIRNEETHLRKDGPNG